MPTPPTISWSELAVGRSGWGSGSRAANLAKLEALGVAPILVDDQPPGRRDRRPAGPGHQAGGLDALHPLRSGGQVAGDQPLRAEAEALTAAGVALVGGLGLWLAEADRDWVVCITGTKGKSTTTAVAGHLLAGLGYRVVTGGNLGVPPWAPEAPAEADFWVVEVSSYQATDVTTVPRWWR